MPLTTEVFGKETFKETVYFPSTRAICATTVLFIIVCQCAVVVVCSDYYSSSVQTTNNKPTLYPDNKDILTLTLIIPPHSHKQHKLIRTMDELYTILLFLL